MAFYLSEINITQMHFVANSFCLLVLLHHLKWKCISSTGCCTKSVLIDWHLEVSIDILWNPDVPELFKIIDWFFYTLSRFLSSQIQSDFMISGLNYKQGLIKPALTLGILVSLLWFCHQIQPDGRHLSVVSVVQASGLGLDLISSRYMQDSVMSISISCQ